MPMPWQDESIAANGAPVAHNFSNWFGDSQAKDKSGQPLILFRGDKNEVDNFNGRREHGIFFACEKERASIYGSVRGYCLKVENPLDLRDPYKVWRNGGVGTDIIETIFNDYHKETHHPDSDEPMNISDVIFALESGDLWRLDGCGGFHMHSWRALQRLCSANGFDAMIVPDSGEGLGTGIDWVVFSGDNVKCVTDHSGLFIPNSGSLSDKTADLSLICRAKDAMSVARDSLLTQSKHKEVLCR